MTSFRKTKILWKDDGEFYYSSKIVDKDLLIIKALIYKCFYVTEIIRNMQYYLSKLTIVRPR